MLTGCWSPPPSVAWLKHWWYRSYFRCMWNCLLTVMLHPPKCCSTCSTRTGLTQQTSICVGYSRNARTRRRIYKCFLMIYWIVNSKRLYVPILVQTMILKCYSVVTWNKAGRWILYMITLSYYFREGRELVLQCILMHIYISAFSGSGYTSIHLAPAFYQKNRWVPSCYNPFP